MVTGKSQALFEVFCGGIDDLLATVITISTHVVP
jgi:hypothetical protein